MSYFKAADAETFIRYSNVYFGYHQISLKPIRERQDIDFADSISTKAEDFLSTHQTEVAEPFFFAGSVDFMVGSKNGEKEFYVLETNGGSSRGFAILPEKYWQKAYDGYLEALEFVEDEPLVLIAHPNRDLLLYEKVFLAESFREALAERTKRSISVTPIDSFSEDTSSGPKIIIGSYSEILPRLTLRGSHVFLDNSKISLLIGDGLVRRHPAISEYLTKEHLETLVVNEIFHLTDDKGLTYFALSKARDMLRQFSVVPLPYWRAHDAIELERSVRQALDQLPEVVIKPHGGSGGTGIEIITTPETIKAQIGKSLEHYHDKFTAKRDPFPYTICKRVDASPAGWQDSQHQYDIRVYVARLGGKIQPIGALARIALEPFTGDYTRKSFVVNLSGYGGVDTDRGLGLSKGTLNTLGLKEEHFASMFAASAALMAYMSNNFLDLRDGARSL